jgi:hypothetical protein
LEAAGAGVCELAAGGVVDEFVGVDACECPVCDCREVHDV